MMSKPTSRIAAALAVAVLATACDSPTEVTLGVVPITLEAVGDMAQLEANVRGSGQLPRWESLDPSVVTVTEAGMVTAVGAGTATVRASIGSRTAEGRVTVLPPVRVTLSDFHLVEQEGRIGMVMRIRNEGGRGAYRLQFWRERSGPGEDHELVLTHSMDSEAPVGLDITHSSFLLAEPADWVMAYSREPHSLVHYPTSCVRLDGGTPCPMD